MEGRAEGRSQGLEEGERLGEQRARVEMVEGLLRAGVGWDVIESATGVNEARFRQIKDALSASGD